MLSVSALGAKDDPWIVFEEDIRAEVDTIAAVVKTTNRDIQRNKKRFSGRELVAWHNFVQEWLKWKKAWLAQSELMRATSGAWTKAKNFKRRALDWAMAVEDRLGVATPGKPREPLEDVSWYETPFAWGLLGVVATFGIGYMIRGFFRPAATPRPASARPEKRK